MSVGGQTGICDRDIDAERTRAVAANQRLAKQGSFVSQQGHVGHDVGIDWPRKPPRAIQLSKPLARSLGQVRPQPHDGQPNPGRYGVRL